MNLQFLACAVLVLASGSVAADWREDYANAWLGDRLRRDNPENFWRDLVQRPSRQAEPPANGPRTWIPRNENPWANTYGTPESSYRAEPITRSRFSRSLRMCTCYLSADARSWDGGPLTEADIARLCRAQC